MKVSVKNTNDSTWFVVALPEEFSSDKHNVLYTGIGKINAAMATQWLIDNYNVREIINVGTAGGNPNKVSTGRVYNIGKVIDRDWNIPSTPRLEIVINDTIDLASCYTGDSFVTDWNNGYEIVDMESFAIAQVCKENKIPFRCYKYISDTGNDGEWQESLEKCNNTFNEMFA